MRIILPMELSALASFALLDAARLITPEPLPDDVASRAYHIIVERDEDGWYVGTVAELPGCHTQAKSLDQLRERIREAIQAYLGARKSAPKRVSFVGVQTIEV